ncbi:hypothetical protein H0S70_00080 [Chryseobacterium manosquense]|uniref:Uncharacterized protein n=1 Tax=Chryseobacterium manosquense TaxID=2754694 RepID=A0A7H1DWS3_9FLAO|nr:hypothetical protein [Chryseobacterium manosquense]QNS41431.1 hypothetical protein H0S70_00080 [Chryseobacterium manosquense]
MKKIIALFIFVILAACNTQKKYSDFDYSYSRSGGYAPIYENLLIKGNNAHYSLEAQGKKFKKDFKITSEERKKIENALSQNNFRMIREDYQKVYDNISTSINVKIGKQSGSKSDASMIMEGDKNRWNNITSVFQEIIKNKINATS